MRRETLYLRAEWICLVVVGVAILAFGVIAATVPMSGDEPLMRADGVASIGVGLLGVPITLIPYRRGERWACFALWFYPVFWVVHLVGRLPPGKAMSTRWYSSCCRLPVCWCPSASSSALA